MGRRRRAEDPSAVYVTKEKREELIGLSSLRSLNRLFCAVSFEAKRNRDRCTRWPPKDFVYNCSNNSNNLMLFLLLLLLYGPWVFSQRKREEAFSLSSGLLAKR